MKPRDSLLLALIAERSSRCEGLDCFAPNSKDVAALEATIIQCTQILSPTSYLLDVEIRSPGRNSSGSGCTNDCAGSQPLNSGGGCASTIEPPSPRAAPVQRLLLNIRLSGVQAPDDSSVHEFYHPVFDPSVCLDRLACLLNSRFYQLKLDLHYANQSFLITGDIFFRLIDNEERPWRSLSYNLVERGLARVWGLHPSLPQLVAAERVARSHSVGLWETINKAQVGIVRGVVTQVISGSMYLIRVNQLKQRSPCCTPSLLAGRNESNSATNPNCVIRVHLVEVVAPLPGDRFHSETKRFALERLLNKEVEVEIVVYCGGVTAIQEKPAVPDDHRHFKGSVFYFITPPSPSMGPIDEAAKRTSPTASSSVRQSIAIELARQLGELQQRKEATVQQPQSEITSSTADLEGPIRAPWCNVLLPLNFAIRQSPEFLDILEARYQLLQEANIYRQKTLDYERTDLDAYQSAGADCSLKWVCSKEDLLKIVKAHGGKIEGVLLGVKMGVGDCFGMLRFSVEVCIDVRDIGKNEDEDGEQDTVKPCKVQTEATTEDSKPSDPSVADAYVPPTFNAEGELEAKEEGDDKSIDSRRERDFVDDSAVYRCTIFVYSRLPKEAKASEEWSKLWLLSDARVRQILFPYINRQIIVELDGEHGLEPLGGRLCFFGSLSLFEGEEGVVVDEPQPQSGVTKPESRAATLWDIILHATAPISQRCTLVSNGGANLPIILVNPTWVPFWPLEASAAEPSSADPNQSVGQGWPAEHRRRFQGFCRNQTNRCLRVLLAMLPTILRFISIDELKGPMSRLAVCRELLLQTYSSTPFGTIRRLDAFGFQRQDDFEPGASGGALTLTFFSLCPRLIADKTLKASENDLDTARMSRVSSLRQINYDRLPLHIPLFMDREGLCQPDRLKRLNHQYCSSALSTPSGSVPKIFVFQTNFLYYDFAYALLYMLKLNSSNQPLMDVTDPSLLTSDPIYFHLDLRRIKDQNVENASPSAPCGLRLYAVTRKVFFERDEQTAREKDSRSFDRSGRLRRGVWRRSIRAAVFHCLTDLGPFQYPLGSRGAESTFDVCEDEDNPIAGGDHLFVQDTLVFKRNNAAIHPKSSSSRCETFQHDPTRVFSLYEMEERLAVPRSANPTTSVLRNANTRSSPPSKTSALLLFRSPVIGAGKLRRIQQMYKRGGGNAGSRFTDSTLYVERVQEDLRGRNAILWWIGAMLNKAAGVFLAYLGVPPDQVLAVHSIEKRRLFREGLSLLDVEDYLRHNHHDLATRIPPHNAPSYDRLRRRQEIDEGWWAAPSPPSARPVSGAMASLPSGQFVTGAMDRIFGEVVTATDFILDLIATKMEQKGWDEVFIRVNSRKYENSIEVQLWNVDERVRQRILEDEASGVHQRPATVCRQGWDVKLTLTFDRTTRNLSSPTVNWDDEE